MDNSRLLLLIDRALADTLRPEEKEELQELLSDPSNEDTVVQLLQEKWNTFEAKQILFSATQGNSILQGILDSGKDDQSPDRKQVRWSFRWFKVVAAAALLTAASAMVYFYPSDCSVKELTVEQAVSHYGMEPGTDKAAVVLADEDQVMPGDSSSNIRKPTDGRCRAAASWKDGNP
ncbi:hypothetical protein [Parapedobacter sp. DT-150]|uniref:hypothetical protein n=1 Tax=Parapedobacter sp. DT-150 TaxID=3396162 RepID=UPI003F1E302E